MMTPAQAVLWQVWRRHRYGFFAGWAYLLVAAAIIRLAPHGSWMIQMGDASSPMMVFDIAAIKPVLGRLLGLPCIFLALHIITAFMLASDANGGYQRHMFALPVPVRFLVAWPMVFGSAALGAWWLAVLTLVLRPAGINAPLWWPMTMLALCLTSLQAMSWTPLTQMWLRVCIAVPLFTTLLGVGIAVALAGVPDLPAAGAFAALVPAMYLLALHGVAMSRRGDEYDWQIWQRIVAWFTEQRWGIRRAFRSPAAAQLWFECRGQAWLVPLCIGFLMLMFGPLSLVLEREDASFGWKALGMFAGLPLFMAGCLSPHLAARDAWSKYAMGSFLATRPLSSWALVQAKFRMCAVSACATFLVVVIWVPLVFTRPGFSHAALETAQAVGLWKAAAIVVGSLAAVLVMLWFQMAASLFVGLTGREWIVNTIIFGFMGFLMLLGTVALWVFLHPNWHAAGLAAVPWLLRGFCSLKLVTAALIVLILIRGRSVRWPTAVGMLAAWCGAVVAIYAAANWLVPASIGAGSDALAGIALSIPFCRLAGAPLVLEWNRHR